MQINHSDLKSFNIRGLFVNNDLYLIPVYQRNYEWGKEQIEQLITDIKDYFLEENEKNYYIGTLIVNKRETAKNLFETIDGQQRLTTINILCCAFRQMNIEINEFFKSPNICFESRKNADDTIEHIYSKGSKIEPESSVYNFAIFQATKIAVGLLENLKKNLAAQFEQFIQYFFEKVHILRVHVPEDTDMNHYFEIMNSRGEQLEKHEILKARLMKELDSPDLRRKFNYIWEACADMNSNVQLHFPKDVRKSLYGDNWFNFSIQDSHDLFNATLFDSPNTGDQDRKDSLDFTEILKEKNIDTLIDKMYASQKINESEAEQFQPIISFENFLLHVLKIHEQSVDIRLDDKRLLIFFENILKSKTDKKQFVKDFAYSLLRSRYLLDQYVIRRKYVNGKDNWSLQCIKLYAKNDTKEVDRYSFVNTFEDGKDTEQLVHLLSMFHVSTPTQIYKYWLFAVLNFLNKEMQFNFSGKDSKPNQISEKDYVLFLENTAKAFVLHRFLTAETVFEYDQLIFQPESLPKKMIFDFESKLSYGNIDNNLVFNYVDYLLWRENEAEFKDFEFSFRSSVEHYYPQHPITGEPLDTRLKKEVNIRLNESRKSELDLLNSFGNLCLISHSNNSRLSNHMPIAKKDYYVQAHSKDSIKQLIMMKKSNWTSDDIFEHHHEMIKLLSSNLFSGS